MTVNCNRIITEQDCRGNAMISLISEFFYILQRYTSDQKIYDFVHTVKFRGYPQAKGFYQLKYDQQHYIKDRQVDFNDINEIFKNRDYLGKK